MRSLERGCGQTTRRIESYVNKQRERAEGRWCMEARSEIV